MVKASVYIEKHPGEERAVPLMSLIYWPTNSGQFNCVCFLVHREEVISCMAIILGQSHPIMSQIYDLQKTVLSFLLLINDADPA